MFITILVNGQRLEVEFSDRDITLENFKEFLRRQVRDYDLTQFSLPESPDSILSETDLFAYITNRLNNSEVTEDDVDVFAPHGDNDNSFFVGDTAPLQFIPTVTEVDEYLKPITNSHGTIQKLLLNQSPIAHQPLRFESYTPPNTPVSEEKPGALLQQILHALKQKIHTPLVTKHNVQPLVFADPIVAKPKPSVNANKTLDAFYQDLQDETLVAFHKALKNILGYCKNLNRLGGLYQYTPSGITFINSKLDEWQQSASPKAFWPIFINAITNEVSNRREGYYSQFKDYFLRDGLVINLYAKLQTIRESKGKSAEEKLIIIETLTKELVDLKTAQEKKIAEALVTPAPK